MNELRLFAVMLGGNPTGAGVEMHDVVFAVGATIEATHEQLLSAWFADGKPPHIDSWIELNVVDGARVILATEDSPPGAPDLWHVNLGYYETGNASFVEGHENLFVVAANADAAKARAKRLARRAPVAQLHTDAIHRVSDRLAAFGSPFRVRVVNSDEDVVPIAHDGYRPFVVEI